jgi:hypothetical protein
MTARIAAPAGAGPEATPDEGSLLVEQALDLLVVLFGGLEEALAEAADSLGHWVSIRLCWHNVNTVCMPAIRFLPNLGKVLCRRRQPGPLAQ